MKSQFEALLSKWTEENTVSKEVSEKMTKDWNAYSKERAGNRWTVALSVIGAILLGIAAITFISANWEELSRFQKLALAIFVTCGSFVIGYYLAYVQQKLPRTGEALIFLSTIAFGGTLALISQVYHLDGQPWQLLFVWLLGVLPVAYILKNKAALRLSMLLFILTLLLGVSGAESLGLEDTVEAVFRTFAQVHLVLILSLHIFIGGSFHLFFRSYEAFGKVLRLMGVKIFLFFLFWMTFPEIAEEILEETLSFIEGQFAPQWKGFFLMFVSGVAGGIYYLKRKNTRESTGFFSAFGYTFLLTLLLFFLSTSEAVANTFSYESFHLMVTILANALFIFACGTLLFEGYQKENMKAVNFATFAIGAFIFGKYIDIFSDYMDSALFFFIGGIILIGGGIFAEKKRRSLVGHFS